MEKGVEKILAKHGCLYMRDDYKALFEELEAYYKPTDTVGNNDVSQLINGSKSRFCSICKSGLIDYPEIGRRTCSCGALGYNVT